MMDVVDCRRGGELMFDHHHFLSEREAPSTEMKVSGGFEYKQGWSCFPDGEGKGFVGSSRSTSTEGELVSSSESTEEDDDYIAELTRQMTHYMLQDDDKHALKTSIVTSSEKKDESWGSVGWPSESMTVWSPLGSSSGSSETLSQESSPPVTPASEQHKSPPTYAAVLCKLDKLETNKQGSSSGTTQVAEAENPKQGVAFDQSQEDSKINLKLKQARSTKKQSSINNGTQHKHNTRTFESCINVNQNTVGFGAHDGIRVSSSIANLSTNPWQGPSSNMKAVFLDGSGGGSRFGTPSCGTGVFLPCVIGNASQSSPKNKRGCAPVLIPAKVVQALKVHFDRVGDLPRQNPTAAFPIQNESSKGGRKTNTSANRKRHSRGAAPAPDMNNNDMGLPQEWTY